MTHHLKLAAPKPKRTRRRTEPPTTNTLDKTTRSAKHANTDSNKPTRNDAPTTETNR